MKKLLLSSSMLFFSLYLFAQKTNPPGLDLIKEADIKKIYMLLQMHILKADLQVH